LICGFVFIDRQMHCLSKQFWDNFLKKNNFSVWQTSYKWLHFSKTLIHDKSQ
jgi:hypothetical protein